ncbi:conserved hypothetical protein [Planktothrix serta PCC 8927]|uniref:Uncharacterized protein n=1 Tax=Planktothrix serta PCC 8927 TaxID=671068 RepID=A0A7Z9BEW4_9CYAN|nr:hypothetical protein [Planktothrix serta]VXD11157.1 conserved hypothetical protein [Planktothrix serta PCC 8927]
MTVEHFWINVNEGNLRQGDYLQNCLVPIPVFDPDNFSRNPEGQEIDAEVKELDLIILTQSCDLENHKALFVALCPIYPIVEFERVNPDFTRKGKWNDVRRGRIEGLHLLASPIDPANNRDALVVDFRQIYSLPFTYLVRHAEKIGSRWRLKSPFLEHFSQTFARFFMRVGLPSSIPEFQ